MSVTRGICRESCLSETQWEWIEVFCETGLVHDSHNVDMLRATHIWVVSHCEYSESGKRYAVRHDSCMTVAIEIYCETWLIHDSCKGDVPWVVLVCVCVCVCVCVRLTANTVRVDRDILWDMTHSWPLLCILQSLHFASGTDLPAFLVSLRTTFFKAHLLSSLQTWQLCSPKSYKVFMEPSYTIVTPYHSWQS